MHYSRNNLPYAVHEVTDWEADMVALALKNDQLSGGGHVDDFERALEKATGAPHAVALSSGTAALHAALEAANVGPGDNVLMPSLTFMAGANMTERLGANCIFYDVNYNGMADEASIKALTQSPIKAMIVVDYAGQVNDHAKLRQYIPSSSNYIVDACHSLGHTHPVPYTDVADGVVYSFHPAKLITSCEGGAYCTPYKAHAAFARLFRNHGMSDRSGPYYDCKFPGMNYRIPAPLAYLGNEQLKSMSDRVMDRMGLYYTYLNRISKIIPHEHRKYCNPLLYTEKDAFNLMVVRCQDIRDQLFTYLWDEGIKVSMHYPPTHMMTHYARKYGVEDHLKETERFAREAITLPLFYNMPDDYVDHVVITCARGIKACTTRSHTAPRHNETPVASNADHQLYGKPVDEPSVTTKRLK